MRANGADDESILAAILNINATQCDPDPLPDDEVRRIVRSACRYPRGFTGSFGEPPEDTGTGHDPVDDEMLSAAPKEEVAAESKLPFYTGRQVAEMAPEGAEWIAPPYVARAAITDLNGKAKASGKTTLITNLCRCVLDGGAFLGQPTTRTGVVYLTEQSPATFRVSLDRAGLLDSEDFVALFWQDTRGLDWSEVVREAADEAIRRGAGLLVVDTLPQFAGLKGDGENNAAAALTATQPLQEAAARGLAIIIVRHERKSGGQVGDSGRGSSAFAGAVDVIMALRRAEGNTRPTIREIHALSRFDETPDELVIELTDEGYKALGTKADIAEAEARNAILEAAPTAEEEAVSLDELLEATELKRTTVQNAIEALLDAGELERTGRGRRGSPYRYWRPPDSEDLDDPPRGPSGGDSIPPSPTRPASGVGNGDEADRSPKEAADPAAGTDPEEPPEVDWYGAVQKHFKDKELPNNVDPSCPAVASVLWRCTDLIKK